jgi:DNA-binding transcriptional MerR regulator
MSSVKIAGLSAATGVSVATLKFYLREGLLQPGVATAVNQAEYDDIHVRRVKLIRALVELGRLSISDVHAVLNAVDDESVPIHDAFGMAQDAMVPERVRDSTQYRAARVEVDRFVERHRLQVRPEAAVRLMLADALVWLYECGGFGSGEPGGAFDSTILDGMVPSIIEIAEAELAFVPMSVDRAAQVEFTVVGTIGFEVAAAAIRRMALEHASHARFAAKPSRVPGRTRADRKPPGR